MAAKRLVYSKEKNSPDSSNVQSARTKSAVIAVRLSMVTLVNAKILIILKNGAKINLV